MDTHTEVVVLGGGCFWCTEAVFASLKGVRAVTPGYAGGSTQNPTYEEVCSGATGHAEVIKVEFDPAIISFHDILTVFFATHDPTTLNRQGNDVGTEYRSIILYTLDTQKDEARAFIHELNMPGSSLPVVTEIKPLDIFYEAEDYQKRFYERNKTQPYCALVINPKLDTLKKRFNDLLTQ
ncbi:MAG: peptide-methionine (S)-S-oxide reductase MsrA [Patescibacteria group bacterium]|nr:peptide-methionine (S)-S-oxide reductase MsrA [Patescibacteria group bacterium]MDE2438849.1 peptide-methionine (S)-S-oxide reductase MsrA [Patescibacteria group bacterium]